MTPRQLYSQISPCSWLCSRLRMKLSLLPNPTSPCALQVWVPFSHSRHSFFKFSGYNYFPLYRMHFSSLCSSSAAGCPGALQLAVRQMDSALFRFFREKMRRRYIFSQKYFVSYSASFFRSLVFEVYPSIGAELAATFAASWSSCAIRFDENSGSVSISLGSFGRFANGVVDEFGRVANAHFVVVARIKSVPFFVQKCSGSEAPRVHDVVTL